MLINVNDKREYSLCSSKRLVLFENRCWKRLFSKWSVRLLSTIRNDSKKSTISIRALLCVNFEKACWIRLTYWIRTSSMFSHGFFSRFINNE
jgi:hypothetical protein